MESDQYTLAEVAYRKGRADEAKVRSTYKHRYTRKAITVFCCAAVLAFVMAWSFDFVWWQALVIAHCVGELAVCFCPPPSREELA